MNTQKSQFDDETLRHSLAHVLAQAVMRLYPSTRLGIGPALGNGFYYEFDIDHQLSTADLPRIEAEMHKIINEGLPFKQIIVPREQAFDTLHQLGQIYKTELLQQIPDESISFYKTGEEFIDLCRGPHVNNTSELGNFKLTKISKVNWMGEKSRPAMLKVEGVGFATREELDEYFMLQEEMKTRDHRSLGVNLRLFYYDNMLGNDLPVWLPAGKILRDEIAGFITESAKFWNFNFVESSSLANSMFFEKSGHQNFMHSKFITASQDNSNKYLLKTDNINIFASAYNSKKRSYKELPYKVAEMAEIFEKPLDSEAPGLMKSKRKVVPTGAIFLSREQIVQELIEAILNQQFLIKAMGFNETKIKLLLPRSTKPQMYLASEHNWQEAIQLIRNALSKAGLSATVSEGSNSFFGPEIVFSVEDSYLREWEIAKIVLDLNLSKTLNTKYVLHNNETEYTSAIYIHFVSSLEKMIALFIEHYGGAFPTWLAPVQVSLIAISEKFNDVIIKMQKVMEKAGIRAVSDTRSETMQAKIRESQMKQIPYMLVVGDKEIKTDSVSVRPRSGKGLGLMRVDEFIQKVREEIANKLTSN